MPLLPLDIPPGYNTEDTDYATGPRWLRGNNVRFRAGRPEVIGGCQRTTANLFEGVARDALGWSDLSSTSKLALATHKKLYIEYGGTFYDITPSVGSGTLGADPITTINGSASVTIEDVAHGRAVGDYVIFAGATAVGGITSSGEYTVTSVTDVDNYVITHSVAASSAATGGGTSVTYNYLLSPGVEFAYAGLGWGAGPYGASTWGTPRATSSVTVNLRTWTLDNWGEDLIACPRGGQQYYWDNSSGTSTRATIISAAPKANFVLVSPTDRHVIALGAVPFGESVIDPMLIRWSDQEDYTNWTPAATTTSGELRLTDGTTIVGAIRTRNEILVWTDTSLYSLQFLGPPYTFGAVQIATGCGMMGPHGATEFGGVVYWFGKNCRNFYAYDGRLQVIPCPVLNYVQDDINQVQSDQLWACTYRTNHEVKFLYCSEGSTEIDREVIYNTEQKCWYFNELSRSLWLDRGPARQNNPVAFDMDGQMWTHETGVQDGTNPLNPWIESGVIDLTPGDNMMFIRRLIPDFLNLAGSVLFTFYTRRYPNSTEITKGPYTIDATTQKLSVRGRGRQMRVRFESTGLTDWWHMGRNRLDIQPDGMR